MNLDLQRLIRRDARRIAATYLFVATVWIWGSDYLLQQWYPDPTLSVILQTVKGIAFVLVTAGLLYLSVRGQLLQRTTIEQVLRSTQSLGEAIFHSANDAILVLNERHEVRDANQQAETLYGRIRSSLIGMPLKSLLASSTNLEIVEEQRTVQEKGSARWEARHLKADGTTFPAEVSAHVLDWDGEPHSVHVIRDVTRRVEYQKRIERLNRTYAVLSDVNQMIVRVRDSSMLFRESCRIAVEKGRFRLAWVGEVDRDAKMVRVVASNGLAVGYLEGTSFPIDSGATSRGPTATAIMRGSYVVCNDISNDPRMEPWRPRALSFELRASAAFPIKRGDAVAYVLNVYSEEAHHFDDQEIELFDEMASDISFALSFNDTLHQLEEHEAVITAFMDNLPGVAFIKDADLRHRFVNREFERTLDMRIPDLMGKRIDELLPGPDADRMIDNDRSVLKRGRSILAEETLRVGDETKIFLASKFPIRRPDGAVWLGGIAIDITERIQAERKLQENEERFRKVFEAANVGKSMTSVGGEINVNRAFARMLGYEPEELRGRTWQSVTPSEDIPAIEARLVPLIQGTVDALRFEKRYLHKDGSVLWADESVAMHRAYDGSSKFFVTTVVDITKRKQVEQALRQSETLVKAVLDNLPVGVAVNSVDPTVVFEYMNDRFPELYRTTREALSRSDSFWSAAYEDAEFREEIKRRVLDDVASGDPARMEWHDVPITRRGEETTYISAHNIRVPDKPLMISTVWDVTARKRAEIERIEMNRRLRTLAQQLVTAREEERKTIAREIHDELGQELTAIRMDLSMASAAPSLEEVRGQLQSATGVADRAIATVRRLARDLRPDVLDQLGLVEALKWLASEHEAHTRMSCRVRIVGDDPQLDDTSATTMFRALQESLTNVVRHANARSVDVLLQTRSASVDLEVLDDGRGADLSKLSHPSGVGIIGIRERVEALGGSFEIGLRPEGGTRVLVRLPFHANPTPEVSA